MVFPILTSVLLLAAQAPPPSRAVDIEPRVKAIAPFLDDQTLIIARVDVTRLDVDAIMATIAPLGKIDKEDADMAKKALKPALAAFIKAGAKDLYVILSA